MNTAPLPASDSNTNPVALRRRGMMFVLSSPSGAGKTTLSRRMLKQDSNLQLSISVTTRPRRPSEVGGQDYFFVDEAQFKRMIENKELLEHARVFDHYYGTPAAYVKQRLKEGKDVLFDIDWQGTRQLARSCREDLVSLFILPPSMAELERRLRKRAEDSEQVVQERMSKARSEIAHWDEYDYVVINNDLEETLKCITSILKAERVKQVRQPGLREFVNSL